MTNISGVNDFMHIQGKYIISACHVTFELTAKNVTHFGIENCTFSVQTSIDLEAIS